MRLSEILIVVLVAAIMYAVWSRRSKPASIAAPKATVVPRRLDDAAIATINGHLAADQKIKAIKVYRDVTGAGLKEAKDAVEAWDPSHSASAAHAAQRVDGPGDELAIGARAVRKTSGDIAAIKYVRTETGWSLLEAKNYVEGLGQG